MAVFAYSGTGAQGEKRSGEVEAATRSEALRRLAMDRIQPLSLIAKAGMPEGINPSGAPTLRAGRLRPGGVVRLRNKDVILFTDELADFLHSGLQLEPALQLMENREEKSPVKDVSAILREKVRDGTAFSEALKVASPSFDELYCNIVQAGEVSGALAPLLRRQSVHLLAMQDLRGRVTLALIYPAALVCGFHDGAGAADDQTFCQDGRRHAAADASPGRCQRLRAALRDLCRGGDRAHRRRLHDHDQSTRRASLVG